MTLDKIYALVLVAALWTTLGLAGESIWVTGPSHKVLRNEAYKKGSPCFDARTKAVTLHAARNEFVSFQIVFPGPRKRVDVPVFTLKGPNGAELKHVERFREHYLPHTWISAFEGDHRVRDCKAYDDYRKSMKAPWEYPVQMVPFSAKKRSAPFDVAAGKNEVVWVDIFVPEKTPAGTYTGTVMADKTALKVNLTVWDFTLPSVSHFPNWAYTGPEQIAWGFGRTQHELRNMMKILDSYFQLAHNHRLCLMDNIEYGIGYMKASDRKFYGYYTGDSFKGPFAAGFGFELLPLSKKTAADADVFKKEGWLNRTFDYLRDEPNTKDQYEQVLRAGAKSRELSKGRIRTFVTEQYKPSKPDWPSLDPAVDIFCSSGTPPNKVAEVEKKGNVVWTYNGGWVGSMLTDVYGSAPRSQAWAGFITGSRAWFFWDGTYATDKHNRWRGKNPNKFPTKARTDVWNVALNFDEATKPWKNGKRYPAKWSIRLNGDGLLFYPGIDLGYDGAIGCFRLKGLRRGTQDFEYLYLLEKMGKKDAALAEAKKLIRQEVAARASKDGQSGKVKLVYEKDPHKWDVVRLTLGKMLDKIGEKNLRAKIKPYNQYPNPVGHPDYYGGKRY